MIWTAQHFKNVSSPQVINRVIVIPLKIPVICWIFLICGNGQADLKTCGNAKGQEQPRYAKKEE